MVLCRKNHVRGRCKSCFEQHLTYKLMRQGAHYREKSGKTGNFVKKIPCRGKSGNLEKTCQGNIREFSACFII